jgi:hypothetical protein
MKRKASLISLLLLAAGIIAGGCQGGDPGPDKTSIKTQEEAGKMGISTPETSSNAGTAGGGQSSTMETGA